MRYIVGLGAFAVLGLAAWLWPPDAAPFHDPLLADGFVSFVLGWMLFTIPFALTLGTLGAVWLLFCTGVAKVEKARRAKVPDRLTVTYSPHQRSVPAPALPAPSPIDITPAMIDVPSFSTLIDRGMIAAGQPLILGYTDHGAITGSWRDLYSAAVAGLSGSGKTSTIRFLASQSALHGARFAIIDPHADAGEESLAATLMPLQAAMLCEPADTERGMLDTVKLIQSQLHARLHGSTDRSPLILAVDEFTQLMRSPMIAPALAPLIETIGQTGRKVNVFCLASGQVWTADRSGGSALRDSLASVYCHRLRRNQARLFLSPDEARIAESLDTGQALLLRTNGDVQRVSLPLATAGDAERVGRLLRSGSVATFQATPAGPPAMIDMPPVRHEVATGSASYTAVQTHTLPSAEAMRAARLFLDGKSPSAIVLELRGIRSNEGKRYQQALNEVLELVRQGVKETVL